MWGDGARRVSVWSCAWAGGLWPKAGGEHLEPLEPLETLLQTSPRATWGSYGISGILSE